MLRTWGAALAASVGLLVASGAVVPTAPVGAQEATPVGTPTGPQERFVRRLLFDLQDDADPTDDTVGVGVQIFGDAGQARSVALAMQGTPEGRGATVDGLFTGVLRRPAEPAARTFFMERLGRIGRLKVAADLIASAEYAARQGGGTEEGWVDALYRDALGRPADASGKAYFVQQRQQGRSRGSIASAVTGGREGRRTQVARLQRELLRRAPDAGGVAFYADRLGAGWSVEQVVRDIVLSGEYRAGAQAVPAEEDVIVLRDGSRLVATTTQGAPGHEVQVTGLASGEQVVAIDVAPAVGSRFGGVLYGLTSQARLVTIASDGSAVRIGVPIAGLPGDLPAAGLDVDPGSEQAVVTAGATRVRVSLDTAAVVGSGVTTMAYGSGDVNRTVSPDVRATAFTNPTAGPPAEVGRMLVLDGGSESLAVSDLATLTTVGPLHLDPGVGNGFDVSPATGRAWALLDAPEAGPALYAVDPATGEPRLLTRMAISEVVGLAVTEGRPAPADVFSLATQGGSFPTIGGNAMLFRTDAPIALDIGDRFSALERNGQLGEVRSAGSGSGFVGVQAVGSPLPDFDPGRGADLDDVPWETGTIRVVNGDRMWRVESGTGVVVGEGASGTGAGPVTLAYAAGDPHAGTTPQVGGLASTVFGSPGTSAAPGSTLYGVDQGTDALVRIDPATGVVRTVASLSVGAIDDVVLFDTGGRSGQTAWLMTSGPAGLARSTIDLATGATITTADATPGGGVTVTAGTVAS